MKKAKISHNVITRLPRYLRYLADLRDAGMIRISSSELSHQMGITASQIRQDFSTFGEFGQQGYGYNIDMLTKEIGDILGISSVRSCIIIGAGNLGRALIANFPFDEYGFSLAAIFDISEETVGTEIGGKNVLHANQLESYIENNRPEVAVLTVPVKSANSTAGRLIDAGITGIWNFTNIDLKITSPNVVVENIHFSDSLLILNYYMSRSNHSPDDEV